MKKIHYFIIALLIAVLGKMLFNQYQYNQQLTQLKSQLSSVERVNANLHDQWIAWQRQDLNKAESKSTKLPEASTDDHHQQQHLNHQIQQLVQNFEFVQFAMQQQQWLIALQRLEQIEQQLNDFTISEHLKLSLQQSIAQDRQQIKQTYQQVQQQQQTIQNLLQHLEQSLQDELKFDYQPQQQRPFWQRLWIIERTTKPTINIAQSQLLLKEIQFDVHILKSNQTTTAVQFQQAMTDIQNKIKQLPEPLQQNFSHDMEKLQQIQWINLPKLTSLDLLGTITTQPSTFEE